MMIDGGSVIILELQLCRMAVSLLQACGFFCTDCSYSIVACNGMVTDGAIMLLVLPTGPC